MTPSWSIPALADALEAGLRERACRFDEEQAVRGLDALDEIALHPLIAEALAIGGFGVHREQRYPADRRKRSESEGERCDLVLTPDHQPLRAPDRLPTLFDPPMEETTSLDEAFWLEVKVVAQFTEEGPNRAYASQLLSTVRHDITKLTKDPGILHAALLLILFTEDEATAAHDLQIWRTRCLERGLPVGATSTRPLKITNRLGHACATISLYPVHRY